MSSRDQTFVLPDGRHLGFAAYGPETGFPVLGFHGIPGSRLQHLPDDGIFAEYPIRLMILDRPGVGLSTPCSLRPIRAWAEDVRHFCHGLQLEQVGVIGVSGGGPYALACARLLPELVRHISLVSALGPVSERLFANCLPFPLPGLFSLALRHPRLTQRLLELRLKKMPASPAEMVDALHIRLSPADMYLLQQPAIAAMLWQDVQESLRQGAAALVHELAVQKMDWGFELGVMAMPLHLYHGTEDWLVAPQTASALHARLPGSRLHWIEGGGHFMIFEQIRVIFNQILQDVARG